MTYTLRVYSRDNEGISSTVITFMTSTGERGSGLAVPCKHGHLILIPSFLLVSSWKQVSSPPHSLPCMARLRPKGSQKQSGVHAQWKASQDLSQGAECGIRGNKRLHNEDRDRLVPSTMCGTKGLSACTNLLGGGDCWRLVRCAPTVWELAFSM